MNLFDFTYCGNYNRHIQNLSRMVPEKWSFGENEDRGILKGYLEHTFQRVYEEGKVLEEDCYAIFNTGLFNYYYQPVYAFFVKNLVPDRQKWFLEGFYTEYYLLKSGIVSLPERAEYVKNPADLVFDSRLEIIPQYEHIFGDEENIQRLPENVRTSRMKVQLFDGALRQARHMLEADYRTAVPQYYDHGIQLLIPVCLQNPGKADLALACVKTSDGKKYLGRTCLTIKMAYHNARLLARLDSSWLHP
ncbi:DUF3825 domain-containing protein [Blautia sp. XA-2221]|uniref:DUF3825 domain-containing protein n=1 Tax=Blautia sp. XA-2221 TaxID=2903961 RepID=UPI002379F6C9|nr:DUF3825 domain-containing protein [Blautia sp. XA-2221]